MVFDIGQRAVTTIIPSTVQNKKPKGLGRPLGKLRIHHPANTTFQKGQLRLLRARLMLFDLLWCFLLSGDFFVLVIYRGRFVTSVGYIGPFFYHRFAAATISTNAAIYCQITVIHTVACVPPMCQALRAHCVISTATICLDS